jgi:hypothetical protein
MAMSTATAAMQPISAIDAEHEPAHSRLFEQTQRKRDTIVAEQPTKRQRTVRIRLTYHGVMIEFGYSAEDNVPIHELEQSIDTMLRREGWAGMPQPSAPASTNGAGGAKRAATWVDPEYDNSGDPRCPVHHKTLKQGTYGSFCPAKADLSKGESANDKGYCNLKFKE